MRLVVLAFIIVALVSFSIPADAQTTPRVPHPPIGINGDPGFLLPTSGVTAGTGTSEDPFIISGWTIDLDNALYMPTAGFAGYSGISVDSTTVHFVIRDVEISGGESVNQRGITMRGVGHARIEDVWINGTTDAINANSGSDDVRVLRAHIQGPGPMPAPEPNAFFITSGISLDATGKALVEDSAVSGHSTGISIFGASDSTLRNVIVDHSSDTNGAAVAISYGRGGPTGTVIMDGVRTSGGHAGLSVSNGEVKVINSTFEMAGTGVQPHLDERGGLKLSIQRSTIRDNQRSGLEGSVEDIVLIGNRFEGNNMTAVRIGDSHGGLIEGNTFTANGYRGDDAAVILYRQRDVRVGGNTIDGNTNYGLELGYGAHNTTVEWNTITNNAKGVDQDWGAGGIKVMSNGNVIRYNNVTGNGGSGIEMWDVRDNVVRDNELSGNDGLDVHWQRSTQSVNDVGPNRGVPEPGEPSAQESSFVGTLFLVLVLGAAAASRFRAR